MPVDLATGTLLSDRYRIERTLGTGGMATVYLAEDRKHGRRVAVKVLRPDLAATVGVDRFEREIELAAGLSHPHILPIHDSGEADGLLYYVMPHVDGESLRRRLDREKQLPVHEALRIARQVADALAYAHERDVVHRDVKPENILLEGRHALLADFGIARAVGGSDADRLTRTGLAVGTPPYMSPEQGAGDGSGDGRADIYALGCVLHEMLAGQPPLMGRTAQATLARRLTESPPPLRHLRETVPAELERLVQKTLARTPADRFATAEELARALERVEARLEAGAPNLEPREPRGAAEFAGVEDTSPQSSKATQSSAAGDRDWGRSRRWAWLGGAGTAVAALVVGLLLFSPSGAEEDSARAAEEGGASPASTVTPWSAGANAPAPATRIAVLPFEDLSPDGRLEHLAAGFTRALIQELSGVDALDVVSYNGVKSFAAGVARPDSIARVVRAGTLVGATVEESERHLRVQVELIDPGTGTNLATTRVDRPRAELFALQDEIVREVAQFLRRSLGTQVAVRQWGAATSSVEAWELVQRAEVVREDVLPLWLAGDREAVLGTLERADALLARAEALDPQWAEPIVLRGWLAETRARLSSETPGGFDEESAAAALTYAERALQLEPESATALELRGTVRFRLWEGSEAPDEEETTLQAAEDDLRAAVAAEPSRARAWATLSELLQLGRGAFAEARRAALRAYQEDAFLADADQILFRLVSLALDLGLPEEAAAWSREGRARFPDNVLFAATELAALSSFAEDPEEVRHAWELHEAVDELSPARWRAHNVAVAEMHVAAILARAGLEDSARSMVERMKQSADEELRRYVAYEEAYVWVILGEHDQALAALGSYLEDNPDRKTYISQDPWFEPLREEARFQELVGAAP